MQDLLKHMLMHAAQHAANNAMKNKGGGCMVAFVAMLSGVGTLSAIVALALLA